MLDAVCSAGAWLAGKVSEEGRIQLQLLLVYSSSRGHVLIGRQDGKPLILLDRTEISPVSVVIFLYN